MLNTITTNEEKKIFSKYEFWRGRFNLNDEVSLHGSCSACGPCSSNEATSSCSGGGCGSCKGCGRD